jgi:hypothetical protein
MLSIRIESNNFLRTVLKGKLNSGSQGSALATINQVSQYDGSCIRRDCSRSICGSIIDNDDSELFGNQSSQNLRKASFLVVSRDDDPALHPWNFPVTDSGWIWRKIL